MQEQDYRTTFELEGHNWWFVGTRRMCLDLIRTGSDGQVDGPILDVGCGTGILLEHLAGYGDPIGLDVSRTALDFCVERRLEGLVQGSGDRLPFGDGTFGLVTAIGVVEHIDADGDAIAEWARVLRPGGQLVLLTSAYQWLWSGHDVANHHYRRYTATQFTALLRAGGLEPVTVSYVNTVLFPPIAAVRAVERVAHRHKELRPRKDTGDVPAPINRALVGVLDAERRVMRRRPLPFGVSMVASATKPA